jgi:hypothetical protein
MRSGGFAAAVAAELAVVPALGEALAGTCKPLVPASGTGASGQLDGPGTEKDAGAPGGRAGSGIAVTGVAQRSVRSSVVRLPRVTRSALDRHGLARRRSRRCCRQLMRGCCGNWPGGPAWAGALTTITTTTEMPAGDDHLGCACHDRQAQPWAVAVPALGPRGAREAG